LGTVGDFVVETIDSGVNRQTIESFCDRACCAFFAFALSDSETAPSFVILSISFVAKATSEEEYGA